MVFFCMQKTAYEMRISDWSSDVCSSDLLGVVEVVSRGQRQLADAHVGQAVAGDDVEPLGAGIDAVDEEAGRRACQTGLGERVANILPLQIFGQGDAVLDLDIIIIDRDVEPAHHVEHHRSEEHTSELQSLMRISYAVF